MYLRLASGREPEVFDESREFEFGKIQEAVRYGTDAAVFASGYIMDRALEAAKRLNQQGVGVVVADVSTIKPIDEEGITRLLSETGCGVTVEDHNIYGGLGSAVCEVACKYCPARVIRVGLPDRYARSGAAKELLDAYGLAVEDIMEAVKEALA